ncbi:MAG TPA: peptide deformylase [Candidatus Dojkabacteria bacterium]|nr:peptide deformylase [Candidatus Dojkabacteria bacterium]
MSRQLKIYTIENKEEEKCLRKKSVPVDEKLLKDPKFREFLDDLLYTALHSEEQDNVPAGGIAAPQVGRNLRAFYTLDYDTDKWQLFINPKITSIGFSKISTIEGCLSVPNIEGEVLRNRKIIIKYQDKNGKWKTKKLKDINAIAVQHELDHLEGVLFIDKMKE